MAVQNAFIIVEGPQDAECLARLLKAAGYSRIKDAEDLPLPYRNLFSAHYPRKGRGIDKPHEVPHFRRSATGCIIAMIIAGGDSKLASSLMSAVEAFKGLPDSIGFVLDDDQAPSPNDRHSSLLKTAAEFENLKSLQFPGNPGQILPGPPRTGVFVMPDNRQSGTLEDILLESGAVAYSAQIQAAREFVRSFPTGGLNGEDLEAGRRPSGPKKQVIGSVATMLKPGRTLQVSLQDNRWLTGGAISTALVLELRRWLHLLLDIPAP